MHSQIHLPLLVIRVCFGHFKESFRKILGSKETWSNILFDNFFLIGRFWGWGSPRTFQPLLQTLHTAVPSHGLLVVSTGALTVGLVRQCQTIHGRDRTCIPPRLPPEWVTTLFFIIMGIISLTVTCGLLVASHWRREATKYARWIAFTGSKWHVTKRGVGPWCCDIRSGDDSEER